MHVALALGVLGLMVVYNVYLKHTLLVGNLVVALVTGLALVYGGWGMGRMAPVLVGAGFAFLTTLAREIVKDLDDRAGDAAVSARTLPLVYGPRAVVYAVIGVLVITLLLTPVPFLLLDYRGLFLLLLLVTDALLLHVLWVLLEPGPEAQARRVSRLLKAVMIAGMIALAFGAIVRLGE
jgi:geranylgeranylglycerol-phosphate geranylgeranyltransferase